MNCYQCFMYQGIKAGDLCKFADGISEIICLAERFQLPTKLRKLCCSHLRAA